MYCDLDAFIKPYMINDIFVFMIIHFSIIPIVIFIIFALFFVFLFLDVRVSVGRCSW